MQKEHHRRATEDTEEIRETIQKDQCSIQYAVILNEPASDVNASEESAWCKKEHHHRTTEDTEEKRETIQKDQCSIQYAVILNEPDYSLMASEESAWHKTFPQRNCKIEKLWNGRMGEKSYQLSVSSYQTEDIRSYLKIALDYDIAFSFVIPACF